MKAFEIFLGLALTAPGAAAGCAGETIQEPDDDDTSFESAEPPDDVDPMAVKPGPDTCGECFRAILCVEVCGGPIVQASCCDCPSGTFDTLRCRPSQ